MLVQVLPYRLGEQRIELCSQEDGSTDSLSVSQAIDLAKRLGEAVTRIELQAQERAQRPLSLKPRDEA